MDLRGLLLREGTEGRTGGERKAGREKRGKGKRGRGGEKRGKLAPILLQNLADRSHCFRAKTVVKSLFTVLRP